MVSKSLKKKQSVMKARQRSKPRPGREPKCTQEERKLQHFRRLQAVVVSMKTRGVSFPVIRDTMWEKFRISIKEERGLFGMWTVVDRENSPGLDPDSI